MNRDPNMPEEVANVFTQFGGQEREILMKARDMILDVAKEDPRIDCLDETLRWGEPAYLTSKSKAGSTIRLGIESNSDQPAIFFNCKTTLVEEFRQQFGSLFRYSKTRAILLDSHLDGLSDALKLCIGTALTYHLRRN